MKPERVTFTARCYPNAETKKMRSEIVDIVPWVRTGVHRTIFGNAGMSCLVLPDGERSWSVSDMATGLCIAKDLFTKEDAIDAARAKLLKNGESGYIKAIEKFKREYLKEGTP